MGHSGARESRADFAPALPVDPWIVEQEQRMTDEEHAPPLRRRSGTGCWYFIHQWFCVLCGRSTEDRERRWTPRPKRWEDRHDYREGACGDHFC